MSAKRQSEINFEVNNTPKRRRETTTSDSNDDETLNNSASTSCSKVKRFLQKTLDDEVFNNKITVISNNSDIEEDKVPAKNVNLKRLNEFLKLLNSHQQINEFRKKKGNCSLSSLLTKEQLNEWPDVDQMQQLFRLYYTKAASMKAVPLPTAITRLSDFLSEEQFITHHPDYPKAPFTAHNLFCRKMGFSMFQSKKNEMLRFQDANDPITREVRQKADEDKVRFYEDLKKFLDSHRSTILPNHIAYLEKRLKNIKKEVTSSNDTPKKPAPKKNGVKKEKNEVKKEKKLTSFDYYKLTKKHKFLELFPEERDLKLKRHFDRLEEDKRKIFEALASNEPSDSD